ncbi:MAG TPA: hypothetical protein VGI39_10740 [Polyangiaceae bacterium]|jgi:hypothetical protein
MSEDTTTWHVQVEAGDVKVWTLDQLDAAFKAGLIDESTFVLESGTTEWIQLGTLLGGGDEGDAAAEAPAAEPAAVAFAPVMVAAVTPVVIAPHVIASEPPPPFSFSPMSTAPVATDLDDLDDEPFKKSSKRPLVVGVGIALVAAAAGVFAFTRPSSAPVVETPVAAVAPPPAPAPAPPAPEVKPADTTASRLNDEQRKRLSDLDKAHEAKAEALQKARATSTPHHSGRKAGKEKTPFHNGGDKFDPLNAKL